MPPPPLKQFIGRRDTAPNIKTVLVAAASRRRRIRLPQDMGESWSPDQSENGMKSRLEASHTVRGLNVTY